MRRPTQRENDAHARVVRIAPLLPVDLGEMMARGLMAGAYCLDAGISITPQQVADIGSIIAGTHGYQP